MRIINTLADITLLEKTNTLPKDYLNLIRQHFKDLMEFNCDGETEEEFTLEQCGPIIVLEPGDNVKDLSIVGLNSAERGLLGTVPETVERIDLDGSSIWKVLIVYNDSYVPTFFLESGAFGEEVEEFLTEEMEATGWHC